MKYIYQYIYIICSCAFYGFLNTNTDKTIHSIVQIGYNTTQTQGMTVQYNALHRNMAQHILLKPVIPFPHPIFRNYPFPPPKCRNKLWQSSGYTMQKSRMSCKTVLILPSHRPAIQGDEIESEILKTLVLAGTVGKQLSKNSPRVRRV